LGRLGPGTDDAEPAGAGCGPARRRQVDPEPQVVTFTVPLPERTCLGGSPMRTTSRQLLLLLALVAACTQRPPQATQQAGQPAPASAAADPDLNGEWRARLQFSSGAFASIKDLEFMYSFNQGGTMTESSNYDGNPPVPPAYGIWRRTGPKEFE